MCHLCSRGPDSSAQMMHAVPKARMSPMHNRERFSNPRATALPTTPLHPSSLYTIAVSYTHLRAHETEADL
eukprot:5621680-Amphidinium_carterae.1